MKIDIYSGFLGAGKTTLIKKMISEAYHGEKLMLIENEFGQIGIDGGFLKESGINITEMNSGCICCSLVGDFSKALKEAIETYHPDRIIIEPSGVGKLSDVVKATQDVLSENIVLSGLTTVADVNKCKMYMKNFGEFFNNQIEEANCIVLSHTAGVSETKINDAVKLIREKNPNATIITTDWDKINGKQILAAIEQQNSLQNEIHALKHEVEHHHHHHHDEHCDCHEHQHHHHHDEHCECHNHHHHHADEIFESWGKETAKKFSENVISTILNTFESTNDFGTILRAKGIVDSIDGEWIYFDYIPGSIDIRRGNPDVAGKLCVIGVDLNTEKIENMFNI